MKRQENSVDMDEQARIKEEMANDDETMFRSDVNKEVPSRPIYYHNRDDPRNGETLAGSGITEYQKQDTTDAEKKADVVLQKADEGEVKASQLNNERQNDENDINAQNTASVTVTFTYPSKF